MTARKTTMLTANALISGMLLLLPVVALAINRALILSGPDRGIPNYLLITVTPIFLILAIALSGFTLHSLLRSGKGPLYDKLRRGWPLTLVGLASLAFLTLIVWNYIRFYNLTH